MLRSGLLALLGTRSYVRNKGHRYERSDRTLGAVGGRREERRSPARVKSWQLDLAQ